MLGRFLELSVAARPLAEQFDFYRSLGFAELPIGDLLTYPYAVVHDGELCIGLHDRDPKEPSLTFIRPDLEKYLHALRRHDISVESAKLGNDEFNEITFRDPGGQLIVLVEAQTFSPGWKEHSSSICGRLLEYSMMTDSIADAAQFWEALGIVKIERGEMPHPWIRLSGHGLTIGLHETPYFVSGPSFVSTNLDARLEYLQAKSISARRSEPRSLSAGAMLQPPEGTPLYLFDESAVPGP